MKGLCFDLIENHDPYSQKCKKCGKRRECTKEEIISDEGEDVFPTPVAISAIHNNLEETIFPLLKTLNSNFDNLKTNLEKTLNVYKTFHEDKSQNYDNFFQLHLLHNIIDNYDRYLNKIVGDSKIDKLLDPNGRNKEVTIKLIKKNIQQHNNWINSLQTRYSKLLKKDNYFSDLRWIKNDKAIQKNLAQKRCQYLLKILDHLWSTHNREASIKLQHTYKIEKYYRNHAWHNLILVCPDRKEIGDQIGISPALVYKYLDAASKVKILAKQRKNSKNKMIYAIGYFGLKYPRSFAFLTQAKHKDVLKSFSPY